MVESHGEHGNDTLASTDGPTDGSVDAPGPAEKKHPDAEHRQARKKTRNHDSLFRYQLRRLINPDKWSLRGRFVYASGILLAIGVTVTYLFMSLAMHRALDTVVSERLESFQRLITLEIQTLGENLTLHAAQAVSRPEVVQALIREDPEALRNILVPGLERIRLETGKVPPPLQFYLLGPTPFFNSWSLKSSGDDTRDHFAMVAASQRDITTLVGIQLLTSGPIISATVPVLADGVQVGSVETSTDFDTLFKNLQMPSEYGLVLLMTPEAAAPLSDSARLDSLGPWVVAEIFGDTDLHGVKERFTGMNTLPSRTALHRIRDIALTDYSGHVVGKAILFYNPYQSLETVNTQLSMLFWLAVGGAGFLWTLLYLNVKRIKVFLDRMRRVLIASHSTDFAERFESDSVHCLEVLNCPNKECPVYQDPSRVCYLETGDEAISPRWRGTCIFLNKYQSCKACPVYRMRHGDELMEMRHVVNTLMRLWALFLGRIGVLLSEVLRTESKHMPSLDEISSYLAQMARLTAYGHDLQGVYDKSEVYRHLEYIFEEVFGLTRFVLMEVNSDENKMEVVIDREALDAAHQEVLLNTELCRAKRMSEDVVSAKNPVLCPYFDINTDTHVRCCLPMVMGGRVGAIFTFVLSRVQWEAKKDSLVVIKKYLDETAPVLSSLRLLQMSRDQALRDPLTHCHNRRFLDEYLSQFEYLSQRQGNRRMGFIMADLDHFKMVNDEFGHQAGDQILQQVTQIIRELIRRSDLLIRYGGEEFLILLVESSEDGAAENVANKIRLAVEAADMVLPSGVRIKKTISLGVSEFPEDADQLYKAIKFADVALYRAKEMGRNRVVRFTKDMWAENDIY